MKRIVTNTTTMNNVAGSLGISTDSVGVGAGLDVNILDKQTDAYIASGATVGSAGAVTIHAESTEHILSIAANAGIGFMTTQAREFILVDKMIFAVVLYALLGKLADVIARGLERAALRWHPGYQGAPT